MKKIVDEGSQSLRLIDWFNPPSEKLPHGDDFRVGPKSDWTPRDNTVFECYVESNKSLKLTGSPKHIRIRILDRLISRSPFENVVLDLKTRYAILFNIEIVIKQKTLFSKAVMQIE